MPQAADSAKKRRRHRRVRAEIPVRISTIEPERDPWTGRPYFRASQEVCANVSRGGAFIKTAELLNPGRRLLIEVEIPGDRPLEAIGRVAWTKRRITPTARDGEAGIGVEFIGGPSDQFSALESFIDARDERPESTDC